MGKELVTAKNVAEYLLGLTNPDVGDIMSNLKLQKLVYYAQGYHLALFDKPLFDDYPIVAWEHGPVVESLYHDYKQFKSGAIEIPKFIDESMFSDEQKGLLDEVFEVLGQFSGWKLRNMTHEELPWKSVEIGEEISNDSMKTYFKTLIEKQASNTQKA